MERNWRRPRRRTSGEYEFQRAFKACLPCARRKVKCMPADDGITCLRCSKKRIDCVFSTKKPWPRGHNGKQFAIGCQGTGPHPPDSPVTTRVNHESAEPRRDGANRPALQIRPQMANTANGTAVVQKNESADRITKKVYELVNSRGEIFITSTVVDDIYVIRVVSANPMAEDRYVRKAFDILVRTTEEVLQQK